MSLTPHEQETIRRIFERLDALAAHEMMIGAMDPATTLALFSLFRDVVRPLNPQFADGLVAPATEEAASQISAKIVCAQIDENTRWGAEPLNPHQHP